MDDEQVTRELASGFAAAWNQHDMGAPMRWKASRWALVSSVSNGGQQLLGGGEQLAAGAGTVGGQDRVAAGDQPLAGVVRAGDLGEVLLVEEAELERAAVGYELLMAGARSAVIHP
jgi:hypothetical protein